MCHSITAIFLPKPNRAFFAMNSGLRRGMNEPVRYDKSRPSPGLFVLSVWSVIRMKTPVGVEAWTAPYTPSAGPGSAEPASNSGPICARVMAITEELPEIPNKLPGPRCDLGKE